MDVTESCSVSGPLATLLRISSVFGLAPLHLAPLRNPPLRISFLCPRQDLSVGRSFGYTASVSRRRAISGYVLVFTTVLLQVLNVLIQSFGVSKLQTRIRSGLSNVYFAASTLMSSATLLIVAFDGINRMKRFISYLSKVEKINEELDSCYFNIKIKNGGLIIWGFLTLILINYGWSIFSIVQQAIATEEFSIHTVLKLAMMFGFCFKHTIQLLVMMQFVFIVCSVNAALRVQNEQLRSLIFKLELYESMKSKPETNAHITIRRLRRTYVSICELVRTIDKGEGALVFMLLVCKLLDIMDSLYFLLSTLKTLDEWSYGNIIKFGMRIYWSLYKGSMLIFLAEPCHKTQIEFQKGQALVSNLMCASKEKDFRDELSRYYDQVTDNVPVFSPLGVCDLSRKFIVTVIGGIATFLAIVLQFHLKDDIIVQSL